MRILYRYVPVMMGCKTRSLALPFHHHPPMHASCVHLHTYVGGCVDHNLNSNTHACLYVHWIYLCVYICVHVCVCVCVYIDSDGIRISIRMLLINDTGVALVMNWGYGDDILPHTHSYIPTKRRTYISVKRHTRCISYHIHI